MDRRRKKNVIKQSMELCLISLKDTEEINIEKRERLQQLFGFRPGNFFGHLYHLKGDPVTGIFRLKFSLPR